MLAVRLVIAVTVVCALLVRPGLWPFVVAGLVLTLLMSLWASATPRLRAALVSDLPVALAAIVTAFMIVAGIAALVDGARGLRGSGVSDGLVVVAGLVLTTSLWASTRPKWRGALIGHVPVVAAAIVAGIMIVGGIAALVGEAGGPRGSGGSGDRLAPQIAPSRSPPPPRSTVTVQVGVGRCGVVSRITWFCRESCIRGGIGCQRGAAEL